MLSKLGCFRCLSYASVSDAIADKEVFESCFLILVDPHSKINLLKRLWSFNNGFGFIDAEGEVIFDCTGGQPISDNAPEGHIRAGKALTQSIHNDICAR